MIVDPGVREQEVEEPGALGELDGVLALVGEERADADAEVLLVGQGRREREREAVVVRLAVDVRREVVLAAVLVRYRVLVVVVLERHGDDGLLLGPLLPQRRYLLVVVPKVNDELMTVRD